MSIGSQRKEPFFAWESPRTSLLLVDHGNFMAWGVLWLVLIFYDLLML
jgi:hypothetical protein